MHSILCRFKDYHICFFFPSGVSGEAKASDVHGAGHAFAVLVGLVSSLAGGASYCFLRAAAKASDQPV